jgi:hypothetical protein
MSKKIIGSIALLAIAAVAVWNVNLETKSNELAGISLANVEALATSEEGSGYSCYTESEPEMGSSYYDCEYCATHEDAKGIGTVRSCG